MDSKQAKQAKASRVSRRRRRTKHPEDDSSKANSRHAHAERRIGSDSLVDVCLESEAVRAEQINTYILYIHGNDERNGVIPQRHKDARKAVSWDEDLSHGLLSPFAWSRVSLGGAWLRQTPRWPCLACRASQPSKHRHVHLAARDSYLLIFCGGARSKRILSATAKRGSSCADAGALSPQESGSMCREALGDSCTEVDMCNLFIHSYIHR